MGVRRADMLPDVRGAGLSEDGLGNLLVEILGESLKNLDVPGTVRVHELNPHTVRNDRGGVLCNAPHGAEQHVLLVRRRFRPVAPDAERKAEHLCKLHP